MRISDWSSDVCSSDLIGIGVFASQPALAETIYLACTLVSESDKNVTHFDVTLNEEAGNAGFVIRETGWSPQKMTAAFTPRDFPFVSPTNLKYSQIGRTSCKVRVFKYV